MPRGKKITKKVESLNSFDAKCAWFLGLTETMPERSKKPNVSFNPTVKRDSNWILNRSKDYTFSDFYVQVLDTAKKLGKNEQQRLVIIKKLLTLVSEESRAIATEVDLIENIDRQKLRLSKGASF